MVLQNLGCYYAYLLGAHHKLNLGIFQGVQGFDIFYNGQGVLVPYFGITVGEGAVLLVLALALLPILTNHRLVIVYDHRVDVYILVLVLFHLGCNQRGVVGQGVLLLPQLQLPVRKVALVPQGAYLVLLVVLAHYGLKLGVQHYLIN